ncbi:unnamed protein product, partial [marine sediment metagenome]
PCWATTITTNTICYSIVWGRRTAYQYVDAGNNEIWETSSGLNYF